MFGSSAGFRVLGGSSKETGPLALVQFLLHMLKAKWWQTCLTSLAWIRHVHRQLSGIFHPNTNAWRIVGQYEPYGSFPSLSLFISFVLLLSLPLFPEGVRTLQHCDLERQATGLLLEILTSKDLSETPSDHPSSRTECLHNTIYTELRCTLMSWVLDCCKTQKMHLRRKSLSSCDSMHVLYPPQIIQKQANMRRMIRWDYVTKMGRFVPRDRNFRSICTCIFNNSIAHITRTYSSDSNPVLEFHSM